MKDIIGYRTHLFTLLGLRDPLGYAKQLDPDCLVTFGLLRQAWNEIPASGDANWMPQWMSGTKKCESTLPIFAAYERLRAVGASNEDLATLARGVLGDFLYRLAYLLDDNSFTDPELRKIIQFGVWAENDDNEPLYRLGCMHELVYEADPEKP
jgi:hypothetical protein